jgi:hypothetical protein
VTTTKKPACAPAPAPDAPARELTPGEFAFLSAYREMDDKTKSLMTRMCVRMARSFPHRPTAKLHLIKGGAK